MMGLAWFQEHYRRLGELNGLKFYLEEAFNPDRLHYEALSMHPMLSLLPKHRHYGDGLKTEDVDTHLTFRPSLPGTPMNDVVADAHGQLFEALHFTSNKVALGVSVSLLRMSNRLSLEGTERADRLLSACATMYTRTGIRVAAVFSDVRTWILMARELERSRFTQVANAEQTHGYEAIELVNCSGVAPVIGDRMVSPHQALLVGVNAVTLHSIGDLIHLTVDLDAARYELKVGLYSYWALNLNLSPTEALCSLEMPGEQT